MIPWIFGAIWIQWKPILGYIQSKSSDIHYFSNPGTDCDFFCISEQFKYHERPFLTKFQKSKEFSQNSGTCIFVNFRDGLWFYVHFGAFWIPSMLISDKIFKIQGIWSKSREMHFLKSRDILWFSMHFGAFWIPWSPILNKKLKSRDFIINPGTCIFKNSGTDCVSPCILEQFEYHENTFQTKFQKSREFSQNPGIACPWIFIKLYALIMSNNFYFIPNIKKMHPNFSNPKPTSFRFPWEPPPPPPLPPHSTHRFLESLSRLKSYAALFSLTIQLRIQ